MFLQLAIISSHQTFGSFQIDRKLVKQTVMTSVYGVTFVGAREQMKKRLVEKGVITDEQLLFTAACYAAKVSFSRVLRTYISS